jgi:bifunctional non-homologous end joining protein LigD
MHDPRALLQGDARRGDDLRHQPIERRKAALAKLIQRANTDLVLNEHIDEPGDVVFRHACKLGLEGIGSKRLGSPYRSDRGMAAQE